MQYETKTHTKYTQINTNKSTHSEMGPVWQNAIQRTVRTTGPWQSRETCQSFLVPILWWCAIKELLTHSLTRYLMTVMSPTGSGGADKHREDNSSVTWHDSKFMLCVICIDFNKIFFKL